MAERGIPFSPPMVRAILQGTKSQTRRVIQPRHEDGVICGPAAEPYGAIETWGGGRGFKASGAGVRPCPYGRPGDRLWVREPWRVTKEHDALPGSKLPTGVSVWYEDDANVVPWGPDGEGMGRYRHARFMPRRFSRIDLDVLDVRVQRLQDVSEEDALAEGVKVRPHASARLTYAALWDEINGEGAWAENPWVWAITFRVLP